MLKSYLFFLSKSIGTGLAANLFFGRICGATFAICFAIFGGGLALAQSSLDPTQPNPTQPGAATTSADVSQSPSTDSPQSDPTQPNSAQSGATTASADVSQSPPTDSPQSDPTQPNPAQSGAATTSADVSQSPPTDASQSDPAADDVMIYVSPTKTILAQGSERILNSPEWTDFYLKKIDGWDQKYLRQEPATVLTRQLEKTFAKTPPSLNDLLDAVFGSCVGIWLHCDFDPETLRLLANRTTVTFATNFNPAQTRRLIASVLDESGFSPVDRSLDDQTSDSVQTFVANENRRCLADVLPALEGDKNQFYLLAPDESLLTSQKETFQKNPTIAVQLSERDRVFLYFRFNKSFMNKANQYFARVPDDSVFAAFAPGMIDLTRRVETALLYFREENGTTVATLTLDVDGKETVVELVELFEKSRNLLNQWAKDKTPTPLQSLGIAILNRAEAVSDDLRFNLVYRLADDEVFQLIQKSFAEF